MTDTPAAPLGELTPRQQALRDGNVTENGISARRTARLLDAERNLSKQQAVTYELIRLRDHQTTCPDISPRLLTWLLAKINGAITRSEQACATQQAVIDALRAGR